MMIVGAQVSRSVEALFGDAGQTQVERAISELRAGRAVIIDGERGRQVVLAAESVDHGNLEALKELTGANLDLVLAPARLRYLGVEASQALRVPTGDMSADRVEDLVRGVGVVFQEGHFEAGSTGEMALELTRFALLLPAVLTGPVAAGKSYAFAGAVIVSEGEVNAFRKERTANLSLISRAPVPLMLARDTEFVVFRGGEGMRDQMAIVVGKPDPAEPVLVRLHSACLTGDLFGSLRCDCGDQLRNAVHAMAEAGGGILLYLDQEGRGNGIANKIRAYRMQADGMDTYEADALLGFDLDGRGFEFAAEMLRQLGFRRIRLMTNNPEKMAAMSGAGIDVVSTQRVYGRQSAENVRYLASKRDRAGHLVDPDMLPEYAQNAAE